MISKSQKAVVDFLSSPANFGGEPVERIDTHLSHVFLVGNRAYKMKRAIKYDFVDFSTIEKRRKACVKELEINRQTAPEMYLGVLPIYHRQGDVTWEENGKVAEWIVEMARFEHNMQLDEVIKRGALISYDAEKLADKIAAFHIGAEEKRNVVSSQHFAGVIHEITIALQKYAGASIDNKDIEKWESLSGKALRKSKMQLDARARHGWVRRCHGDLHLANICIFDGEPTPFDAIEFNDELASIDVLYDLAFLLMDLEHHNRKDLGNLLLNRYLSATRDYSGLSLLPLFQSLRAAVRAMVLILPSQQKPAGNLAKSYFQLALDSLSVDCERKLIAIGGYSGTGKSTLARNLAHELHDRPIILRSDVIRKRLEGVLPETHLENDSYSEMKTEQVYHRLFADAARALRAGQTVIVDATFLSTTTREKIKNMALKIGVPFIGIWLSAPREILIDRVTARQRDASDSTAAVVLKQLKDHQDLPGWQIVDAGKTPQNTLDDALRALAGESG